MEGGWEKLCCFARNERVSAQGKKVLDGRCGRTIEAKPLSDQTCLIEPAEDVVYADGSRETP
ncbi:hypothetical protein JOH51_007145 [Rhizobium leguminosarum]|nr:hypothetical protein [Rhizobium leguminosarum]